MNRRSVRFPGLDDDPDPRAAGPKFVSLARAALDVGVPPAVAVPVEEFRAALSADRLARIQGLMDDLRATVGAFFVDIVERIEEQAADLRLPDETRSAIAVRLTEVFDDPDGLRFAVRSSGLAEDGPGTSLAGIYHSWLDVRGTRAVPDAVELCWRSFYSPPAIAARVRAGDFSAAPSLAVFIQEFVDPTLAGVAFCGLDGDSDEVLVEYVAGSADGLVAGTDTSCSASSAALHDVPAAHRSTIAEVVRITHRLRQIREHDLDVEWAADHRGVHVVQVRPVTARRTPAPLAGAGAELDTEFWVRRLYFEQPAAVPLGDVAGVYTAFEAKRGRANRLARDSAVPVTTGWVVGFTGRAIHDPATAKLLDEALQTGSGTECLLDVGTNLRQIIVPRTEVVDRVRELAAPDPDSDVYRAVIVRDYLVGQLGVVSRRSGGSLVVEYSPDGLLALNRGTAEAQVVVADDAGSVRTASPDGARLLPHFPQIATFTDRMRACHGDVAVEWALVDDELVFLDYSVLGADHPATTYSGVVVSAGSASGPVLNLVDDETLRRLSIGPAISLTGSADVTGHVGFAALLDRVRQFADPPIVRASLPYAALSVLIGSVAGFVFSRGSVLSHLAILLREAGVPAVCADDVDPVPDGVHGAITNGTFGVVR